MTLATCPVILKSLLSIGVMPIAVMLHLATATISTMDIFMNPHGGVSLFKCGPAKKTLT